MVELTDKDFLISGDATEAEFQEGLGALYDFVKQLAVGAVPQYPEIVDGALTPAESCFVIIDTENDTATDDLNTISPENLGTKTIYIKSTSNSRIVTLKHLATGTGQIYSATELDIVLYNKNCFVALAYNETLDRWEELWRNFGVFAPTSLAKTAARAALDLGTAAVKAAGTGAPGNVPMISDLGALAFLGALTAPEMLNDGIITNAKLAGGITIDKLATTTPNSIPIFNASGVPQLKTAAVNNTFLGYNGSGIEFIAPDDDTGLVSIGQNDIRTSIGGLSLTVSQQFLARGGMVGNLAFTSDNNFINGSPSYVARIGLGGPVAANNATFAAVNGVLPGGSYGFEPIIRTRYSGSNRYLDVNQTFITASPPFNIGEGDTAGFVYLLMEGSEVKQVYICDTPPWVYNGPTNCAADLLDRETGLKYRRKPSKIVESILAPKRNLVNKKRISFAESMENSMSQDRALTKELINARNALGRESFAVVRKSIEQNFRRKTKKLILSTDYEEITHQMKNSDMGIIPHPFEVKQGQTVVLAGLYSDLVNDLITAQNYGEDIIEHFFNGNFYPDNEIKRGLAPNGVKLVDLKVK